MKKTLLIILLAAIGLSSFGQGLRDVKINEVLVKNVNSYADDHANHVGWIELYNAGYSQVNLSGAHLTLVQGTDTITYRIPKTDIRTIMAPQGYVVFFADGSSNKGTFHTNFSLNQTDSVKLAALVGIDDKLYLYDQGGVNVVDSLVYDVNTQIEDVSYGRVTGDDGLSISLGLLPSITPMQSNDTVERVPKNEMFRREDPSGVVMSFIAMTVVFIALIALYLVFKNLGKYMHKGATKKKAQAAAAAELSNASSTVVKANSATTANGEEIASIAIALLRYTEELHDIESEVITINRVARVYSPWSSKIHTLTQIPNRNK